MLRVLEISGGEREIRTLTTLFLYVLYTAMYATGRIVSFSICRNGTGAAERVREFAPILPQITWAFLLPQSARLLSHCFHSQAISAYSFSSLDRTDYFSCANIKPNRRIRSS